jgi:hypothetical protein
MFLPEVELQLCRITPGDKRPYLPALLIAKRRRPSWRLLDLQGRSAVAVIDLLPAIYDSTRYIEYFRDFVSIAACFQHPYCGKLLLRS